MFDRLLLPPALGHRRAFAKRPGDVRVELLGQEARQQIVLRLAGEGLVTNTFVRERLDLDRRRAIELLQSLADSSRLGMAKLFEKDSDTVDLHLKNNYAEGELE